MVVLGIDTGGTKIAGAVVNENGEILERKTLYRERSGVKLLNESLRMYRELTEYFASRYDLSAIGIGVGGTINPVTGVSIAVSRDNEWQDFSVVGAFHNFIDLPVAVENDGKVAIYGEIWQGAVQNYHTGVGVILGTGVGGGYFEDGEVFHGRNFRAGEVGHIILYPHTRPCDCGQIGCVETYCSGTALWREYNRQMKENVLRNGYGFFQRVNQGDLVAQQILDRFAQDLGTALVSYARIYDPEVIYIGGGLIDTAELWWDKMEKQFRKECYESQRDTPVVKSSLGNDAALLGAAKIAFKLVCSQI